jgi:hypothetical protein
LQDEVLRPDHVPESRNQTDFLQRAIATAAGHENFGREMIGEIGIVGPAIGDVLGIGKRIPDEQKAGLA